MAKDTAAPEKKEGTSIVIDLSGRTDILQQIKKEAEADDRPASVYLRRKIIAIYDQK